MREIISASERPDRLLALCEALGYGEDLRSEGFAVLMGDGVVTVDLACFGRPEPKDISTATLIASRVPDDRSRASARDGARALAAPVALLEHLGGVELWRIAASPDQDKIIEKDLREDTLSEKARLLDALSPESLVAHKQRFTSQLAMFDHDVTLLSRARTTAEKALGARIENAMADLWPSEVEPSPQDAATIARTVVQALAVLVARDKLTADREFDTALAVLQERYGESVRGLSNAAHLRAVKRAAGIIGEGVRFDSLDATILGDVYEGTFLKDVTRRHLGAYYTPPAIARRMLDAVPVEELAPDERTALDLTCGSGTLLLAAWDRFASAIPPGRSRWRLGSPGHLTGFDKDTFAVELARLALILHDAPGRPTWAVDKRDALRPRRGGEAQHGLVVGNPPWKYERPDGQPVERATEFLDVMLRWCRPDGFVACLLPASWLTANVARGSRASLRAQADVLEVWRLPETTFDLSAVASCVVFARKREPHARKWLYRRVTRKGLPDFIRDVGSAPGELVVEATSADSDAPFQPQSLIDSLPGTKRLIEVAEVRRGTPLPKGQLQTNPDGNVEFLLGYRELGAFDVVAKSQLIRKRYPEDISRRGISPEFWTRPKVLMATTTNVENQKRVRAFLDERGVVPRNSMTAVVPRSNTRDNRLALLAILNSGVVAQWLDGISMRWINSEPLENIPVPPESTWERLARSASDVVRASPSERTDALLGQVEREVRRAYGLTTDLPDQWSTLPTPAWDPVASGQGDSDPLLTVGTVLECRGREIRMHVAGVTPEDGEWMVPPPRFPGWACDEGCGFQVLGADHDLRTAVYFPQEMAWRRDEVRPAFEVPA